MLEPEQLQLALDRSRECFADQGKLRQDLLHVLGYTKETTGVGVPPTTSEYLLAFRIMAAINIQNNPRYADSWCRRGEQGIFHNIGRKFDRMEQQVLAGQHAQPNETVDLAVYGWMHFAWQLRNNPRPLLEWFDKEFKAEPGAAA